jgi:hypothetical protein
LHQKHTASGAIPMKTLLSALIILISTAGYSQQPLEIAQQIFGTDSTFNISHYITDEYDGHPNGSELPPGTNRKFLLLTQTDNMAVVAMSLTDASGDGIDTYLHFKKEDNWKMSAFRTLALTSMIARGRDELENMTDAQIDTIIKISKKDKQVPFTSWDEYNYMLDNADLTLDLDDHIIEYFNENKKAFDTLKDSLLRMKDENPITVQEQFLPAAKRLLMSNIHISRQGYIEFVIGGMTDNLVGYMYVKDKRNLPEMSPDNIIMIREIGDGWYIYKTT